MIVYKQDWTLKNYRCLLPNIKHVFKITIEFIFKYGSIIVMYSHMALMIVFNIPGLKNPVYHRIAVKCCPRIRWPRLNLNKATWKLLIFNTIGRFLLLSFFPLPSALLGGMFSFNKITRNGTFSVLEKIGDLSL